MPTALVKDPDNAAEIISAPSASQRINILGLNLTGAAQVQVELVSGGQTIWTTYAMNDASVIGGIVLPFDGDRDMPCPYGAALTIELSGAVGVRGTIEYSIQGARTL